MVSVNNCKAHVVEGAHTHVQPGLNTIMEPFLFDHRITEMEAGYDELAGIFHVCELSPTAPI